MSDDLIIIDNPEGIEAYRKLSMWHMLKLEVQTGLRHSRGSVMNAIKREYPQITARRKQQVLEQFGDILLEEGILHSAKASDGH